MASLRLTPGSPEYLNFYVKPDQVARPTPDEVDRLRMLAEMQDDARAYAERQKRGATPSGIGMAR